MRITAKEIESSAFPISGSLQAFLDGKPVARAIGIDEEEGWVEISTATGSRLLRGHAEIRMDNLPLSEKDRAAIQSALPAPADAEQVLPPPEEPHWQAGDQDGRDRAFFSLFAKIERHLDILVRASVHMQDEPDA